MADGDKVQVSKIRGVRIRFRQYDAECDEVIDHQKKVTVRTWTNESGSLTIINEDGDIVKQTVSK